MPILAKVAEYLGRRKLTVATVASQVGDELWDEYRGCFRSLGVRSISHLDVINRSQPVDNKALRALKGAGGVFFSGGDQFKITSELGGTPVLDKIYEIYQGGGVIAGTSAGASVMGETMLVADDSKGAFRIGSPMNMAPGLGLVKDMIIDQHFAERGRLTRLIAAVAQNPKYLGVGIDENTVIVMESQAEFRVIGQGAVYVLDAHETTESNISTEVTKAAWSVFNLRFHVLSEGDHYQIKTRIPQRRASAP